MSEEAPNLDEAIRAYPEILERLKVIEANQERIISLLSANQSGLVRPLYDIDQLMELGISRNHGYDLLRDYGKRVKGRLRITQEQLTRYYQQEGNS